MAPIAREHHGTILGRIKIMSELDIAEKRVPQDGRFRVRYKHRLIDFPRVDHAHHSRRKRRLARPR